MSGTDEWDCHTFCISGNVLWKILKNWHMGWNPFWEKCSAFCQALIAEVIIYVTSEDLTGSSQIHTSNGSSD